MPDTIAAPADLRHAPIPDRLHEHVEYEVETAAWRGYQAACRDIAARHAELAAVWQATGRTAYEQRVAERITEMETAARTDRGNAAGKRPWNTWRGQYPGGPLDWHTGQPAQPQPAHLDVGAAA